MAFRADVWMGDIGPPWNSSDWAPITDSIYNGTSKSTLVVARDADQALFTGTLAGNATLSAEANGRSFTGVHTVAPLGWNLTGTDGLFIAVCGFDLMHYTVTLANDIPVDSNVNRSTLPDLSYHSDWWFDPELVAGTTPDTNTTSTNTTATTTNTTAPRDKVQVITSPAVSPDWHYPWNPPPPPHVMMPWLIFETIDRTENSPPLLDLGHLNRLSIMVRSDANEDLGECDLCIMFIGSYTWV